MTWRLEAACLGKPAELWFPDERQNMAEARAICRDCPVWRDCLTYAQDNDIHHGMWGGFTLKERQRLRRPVAPIAPNPCVNCGQPCPPRRGAAAGRPRTYCSPECRLSYQQTVARRRRRAAARERVAS